MTDNKIDLDVFFEDAKQPAPDLSAALMSNILADAGEVAAARPASQVPIVKRRHWLVRLMEPIGGTGGMVAVGVSIVLGVTVGYAGTDSLQSIPGVGDIVASISGDPLDDFSYDGIANFSDFLAEG